MSSFEKVLTALFGILLVPSVRGRRVVPSHLLPRLLGVSCMVLLVLLGLGSLAAVGQTEPPPAPTETAATAPAAPSSLPPVEEAPAAPAELAPAESSPAEPAPTEATPAETATPAAPSEAVPTEAGTPEPTPSESAPGESVPSESVPAETAPTSSPGADSVPAETTPAEPAAQEPNPGQTAPSTPADGEPVAVEPPSQEEPATSTADQATGAAESPAVAEPAPAATSARASESTASAGSKPSEEKAPPPEAPPKDPRQALLDYETAKQAWKKALTQLGEAQWVIAFARGPNRMREIEAYLAHLQQVSGPATEQLLTAAKEAYRSAPNQNQEVADFLLEVVREAAEMHREGTEYLLGEMLGNLNHPDKKVWKYAATLAFDNEAHETAIRLFERAKEAQVLDAAQADRFIAESQARLKDAEADNLPHVLFETGFGNIECELFEDVAPNTVANFVTLAQTKYYDNHDFFRVDKKAIQGGCPRGDGRGDPGYSIKFEGNRPDARKHFRGSLAMAHGEGLDTAGSIYFFTRVDTPELDGRYTVFGRVVLGWELIDNIAPRTPDSEEPSVKVSKVRVIRDRGHAYPVEKVSNVTGKPLSE